jgi:hypothetical protein
MPTVGAPTAAARCVRPYPDRAPARLGCQRGDLPQGRSRQHAGRVHARGAPLAILPLALAAPCQPALLSLARQGVFQRHPVIVGPALARPAGIGEQQHRAFFAKRRRGAHLAGPLANAKIAPAHPAGTERRGTDASIPIDGMQVDRWQCVVDRRRSPAVRAHCPGRSDHRAARAGGNQRALEQALAIDDRVVALLAQGAPRGCSSWRQDSIAKGRRRHRRSAIGKTRVTAGCICGMSANDSSTTQSIRACGKARAISETIGRAWTMSPIDEVLTIRTRTLGSLTNAPEVPMTRSGSATSPGDRARMRPAVRACRPPKTGVAHHCHGRADFVRGTEVFRYYRAARNRTLRNSRWNAPAHPSPWKSIPRSPSAWRAWTRSRMTCGTAGIARHGSCSRASIARFGTASATAPRCCSSASTSAA